MVTFLIQWIQKVWFGIFACPLLVKFRNLSLVVSSKGGSVQCPIPSYPVLASYHDIKDHVEPDPKSKILPSLGYGGQKGRETTKSPKKALPKDISHLDISII